MKVSKKLMPVLAAAALLTGSLAMMSCGGDGAVAEAGDTVKVLYVGTFDDGEVFDASSLHDNVPLEFTAGAGEVIPGFDQAVLGMEVGETKNVHIPVAEAYGPANASFAIEMFSGTPEVGDQYQVMLDNGSPMLGEVIEVTETEVTLRNTHPLAGKALNFEIEIVEIIKQ